MKSSDLKVVAIILAIALFFTIVTSNAVSIASVVLLAKGDNGSTIVDGNNGNNGNNGGNGGNNNSTPADNNGNNSTPADNNGGDSNTPADNNSGNGGSSNTPADNNSGNGGGSNAPAGNNSGNGGGTNSNEWDKTKTFNFYKAACDKITSTGAAGHTRKEWQEIKELNLGSSIVTNLVKPIITSFMKTEDQASESVSDKGSDDAKRRMAPCGADISYVKSATKKDLSNGNYQITIVMNDENTPKKGSKGIASMSTGILYMEDVQETVKNNSTVSKVVKSLDKAEIIYQAYTIVAEMTKDGKFVSIEHHTDGAISASAKLSVGSMNGTGTLAFYSKWYNFKY